jgi:hypothetical protein
MRRLALLPALLALSLAACATTGGPALQSGPSREVYQFYFDALTVAGDAYHETLAAAGRAHRAGLLSDEGLQEVLAVGRVTHEALGAGKRALAAYLETGDLSDLAPRFAPKAPGSKALTLPEVQGLEATFAERRSQP